MKKLTILLTLLLSFVFSQIMMPDTSKMTNTEKIMWYQNEKKSAALAVGFSVLLPSAGHAYAGDWTRGLKFKSSQILLFIVGGTLAAEGASREWKNVGGTRIKKRKSTTLYNVGVIMCIAGPIAIYIWELIDVAKTTKKYNNQLYKNIFGKDPSMQFSLIPQPKGIGLGLSYNF